MYDGPLSLSGGVPPGITPSLFDLAIDFETPFFYNHLTGALIVEIRKYGSEELGSVIGAAELPGTTFFYRSADGTQTLGNIGLETEFRYQVVPEPSAAALLLFGLLSFRWLKCSRN